MSEQKLWLKHLSSALAKSGQIALLQSLDENRIELMGDIHGILGGYDPNSAESVHAHDFLEKINPQDLVPRLVTIHDALRLASGDQSVPYAAEFRISRRDGSQIRVQEKGVAFRDVNSGLRYSKSFLQPMTAAQVASGDDFSSVSSFHIPEAQARAGLLSEIERIQGYKTEKGILLICGIDRLRLVNQAYGEAVGDEVVVRAGMRLSEIAAPKGRVLRLSGDVFTIIYADETAEKIDEHAARIIEQFSRAPIVVGAKPIHVALSVGGAPIQKSIRPGLLLLQAESSLRHAKAKGRGSFVTTAPGHITDVSKAQNLLDMGDAFLKGFKDNRLHLAFQQIIDYRTGNASFHECLVRLQDEKGSIIPAGAFMGAVEDLGLTRLVDQFCVTRAIQELTMFPELILSVNVSRHTLEDETWLSGLKSMLRDHTDVARRLIVEITESEAMADPTFSTRAIGMIRDLGCKVALDDFGAGQTAFAQLKDWHLDMVKIDQGFVRSGDRSDHKLFIKTLSQLADGLQLDTVGEGAETMDIADALAENGIWNIQGYVYGRPSLDRIWLPEAHSMRIVAPSEKKISAAI